ncbi:MAG: hypothetical protein ACKO3T_27125 [Planctomycetaceae bacterium]
MIPDRIHFDHAALIAAGGRHCQLQWSVRGESALMEPHAVAQAVVAEHYVGAIQRSVQRLTQELGWNWSRRHPDVIDVEVIDLGPGLAGLAVTDLHEVPYLRLSCRRFVVDDESESRRRGSLVLHEFVHLMQFGTDVWWSWPYHGSLGVSDPNNWLHEGVALATEAVCGPATADWYSWLWKWAVAPHLSLDSDESGTRAAPFLVYLAQKLDLSFLSDIYSDRNVSDSPKYGTELLDSTVQRRSETASLCSMFTQFCAAWLCQSFSWSPQATGIHRIVGDRANCEVVSAAMLSARTWHSEEWSLNHLACRYYSIRDLIASAPGTCDLSVVVADDGMALKLSCIAVVLTPDGTPLDQLTLHYASPNRLAGSIEIPEGPSHLRIVVVNSAHGSGWALHDDIRFQLQCSWSA